MSKEVGMSSCCLSGKVNEGTPVGHVETIGGLQTYVSEPENKSKSKTIIFLTDIFGWEFKNTRLLADNYAKAGFYTYIPDVFNGDAIPISFLDNVEPNVKSREQLSLLDKGKNQAIIATTLPPWLIRHREGVSKPIIDGFINAVRHIPGTNKIGAVGFCWGGRYAILEAHGSKETASGSDVSGVDAAYACHPSLVAVPGDFDPITKPISFAVGDNDSLLDNTTVGKIQDLMAKKTDVPHEFRIYENQVHGFALRSDWSDAKDKEAMDESEKQGIAWFNEYLS
ncbi:MAG: hypothetical protein M1827_000646 [Pycnora praestabilis]|nr:MAG: hypothetical protein M1827_000646 [Pycnora praestabilis]